MRWLIRTLIFWAITAPLFYAFGLPYLMTKLQHKAQDETYLQCQDQLKTSRIAGGPMALLKEPQADSYCRCVSNGVTLERADLPALARHIQPPRLAKALQTTVDACNTDLQESMKQLMSTGSQPYSVKDANGVETVYFK